MTELLEKSILILIFSGALKNRSVAIVSFICNTNSDTTIMSETGTNFNLIGIVNSPTSILDEIVNQLCSCYCSFTGTQNIIMITRELLKQLKPNWGSVLIS